MNNPISNEEIEAIWTTSNWSEVANPFVMPDLAKLAESARCLRADFPGSAGEHPAMMAYKGTLASFLDELAAQGVTMGGVPLTSQSGLVPDGLEVVERPELGMVLVYDRRHPAFRLPTSRELFHE